jgi:hypothetical protein
MKRRAFLAGLAAAPLFIRRAFADQSCPLPSRGAGAVGDATGALAEALKRAQKNGRTLLVFVIPEDDALKYDRGAAFGAWLNHGTDVQIAPLSACEVVCARMAEIRKALPFDNGVRLPVGEPLMVAFWMGNGPAIPLHAELPVVREGRMRGGDDWDKMQKREADLVDARIAVLAKLLRHLRKDDWHFDTDAARHSAEVRARLVKQRVAGSRWAHASGCGTTIEGEEDQMRAKCGMGHVPEKARRFLYFYVKAPGQDDSALKQPI